MDGEFRPQHEFGGLSATIKRQRPSPAPRERKTSSLERSSTAGLPPTNTPLARSIVRTMIAQPVQTAHCTQQHGWSRSSGQIETGFQALIHNNLMARQTTCLTHSSDLAETAIWHGEGEVWTNGGCGGGIKLLRKPLVIDIFERNFPSAILCTSTTYIHEGHTVKTRSLRTGPSHDRVEEETNRPL